MTVLPNSHEVLLRNQHHLQGRTALIGAVDPVLLPLLNKSGFVVTEHFGNYRQLLEANDWQAMFGYDDAALEQGLADTLVIFLPKARSELSLRLALASWLAAEGASLLLIGEKREGIAGAVKQLKALAPDAAKIDSARHCQVWKAPAIPGDRAFHIHDWLQWHPVERAGIAFDVAGLPGIFSEGHLDDGTAMLLDTLDDLPLPPGPVLDFACGAGVIGTWLELWQRKQGARHCPVDGVDVQAQAIICARETILRAGATGTVQPSEGLSDVQGQYQAIVSNPPFHSGVRTDMSMTEAFLKEAGRHLLPGGELRLVANSFLPYEDLMRKCIGPVGKLASDRRFTVYRAQRS